MEQIERVIGLKQVLAKEEGLERPPALDGPFNFPMSLHEEPALAFAMATMSQADEVFHPWVLNTADGLWHCDLARIKD
jgi:hypothetical protein